MNASTSRSRRPAAAALLAGITAGLGLLAVMGARPMLAPRLLRMAQVRWEGGRLLGQDGVVLQRAANDCGPAALANLLILMGVTPPPLDSIALLAGTTAQGTSLGALARAAAVLGQPARVLRFVPARVAAGAPPTLVWIGRSHFVVLAARSAGGVLTVVDPQIGRYRVPEAAFAKDWSGEALVPISLPLSPGGTP
jgi:predicted double-glycine peptidase